MHFMENRCSNFGASALKVVFVEKVSIPSDHLNIALKILCSNICILIITKLLVENSRLYPLLSAASELRNAPHRHILV